MQTSIRFACILLTLIAFTATSAFAQDTCVHAPRGLISWWTGDGNALDSRSQNPGSLQNGATFAAGRVGQAFRLDGVDDSIDTSAARNPNLNFGANNFTIEAWVNTTSTGEARTIYANGYNLNSNVLLRIEANNRAGFRIRDNSGNVLDALGTVTNLNDGAWHHIAGMRDGTTARLYVNGVLQNSATNNSFGVINSACNFAFIGGFKSDAVCGTPANEALSNGSIDEVSLYDRALTGAEVAAIFNAGAAGKCKAGGDADSDGVADGGDNCRNTLNSDQLDTDLDRLGNACDSDDDNDGVADGWDSSSLDPRVCQDSDGDTCDDCLNGRVNPRNDGPDVDRDGLCNLGDADADNDDTPNPQDSFSLDPAEWLDTDEDNVGNNADPDDDGDGILDAVDNCPWHVTASQGDDDGDFIGNECDDPIPNPDVHLVFVRHDGNPEIYVMNANGGVVRLTTNTSFDVEPALSPDRSRVAFSSNRDGNFAIYSMNIADQHVTRLTDPFSDGHPRWSPDGNRIVFTSNRPCRDISDGHYRIFTMNAGNGSDLRCLSYRDGLEPTWSPNGRKIAFTGDHGFIFTINSDGTGLKQLRGGWNPTWSPDGSQIAFVSRVTGKTQIHFMNANGGVVRRLTTAHSALEPEWGANNKIAYTGILYGAKVIFRKNVDGTLAPYASPDLQSPCPGSSPHW